VQVARLGTTQTAWKLVTVDIVEEMRLESLIRSYL
jgi:hypothetical protein